ncbi:MAG: 50S ribosomal protein L15 [Deltaproteobacteria bacterium]|nr:50S ribosomal protein L15 [Deltaproteobacteria bacterium]
MLLNTIRAPKGATKSKKRLGRGESSGLGKTSGRGHKGQKARSGGYHKVGFEGGQMPLARRLPKRGFTNIFQKSFVVLNVSDLASFKDQKEISIDALLEKKLIKKSAVALKILGDGEIDFPLTIKAAKFSKSAKEKIEKAGGQAIVV